MHDSILARALKKMTAEGLLIRDEKPGGFPSVYYSLTPQVVESLRALAPLLAWVRAHRAIIERAQAHSRHHAGRQTALARSLAVVEVGADPDHDLCGQGDTPGEGQRAAS